MKFKYVDSMLITSQGDRTLAYFCYWEETGHFESPVRSFTGNYSILVLRVLNILELLSTKWLHK